MVVTVNVYYRGQNGSARAFAEEVRASGVLAMVHAEPGCERYCYHVSMEDPEVVLLAERWSDMDAFEAHVAGEPIRRIGELKERFGLTADIERFGDPVSDA